MRNYSGRMIALLGTGLCALAGLPPRLAEYNFLAGSDPAVLYATRGPNGTIGSGASYGPYGLTTGGAAGWADTGVPESSVKTIVVYMTPQASSGAAAVASSGLTGGLTPQFTDLPGDVPNGVLTPRFRDLVRGTLTAATGMAAPSWPFSYGLTFGNPMRIHLSGVQASIYDQGQDDGTLVTKSFNVRFGNNFANTGANTNTYHYALLFDRELSAPEMLAAHYYCVEKCKNRTIPVGGPLSFTGDLLTFTGNSVTNLLDLTQITPTHSFAKVKAGLGSATPPQFLVLAEQAIIPLYRPLAARNYAFIWPTALGVASDIPNYVAPWCNRLRNAGRKVGVITAISGSGFDTTKNAINAYHDAHASEYADVLCDLRSVHEVSDDGAYANTTYFSDGLHPTTTGYGLMYPGITSSVNTLG